MYIEEFWYIFRMNSKLGLVIRFSRAHFAIAEWALLFAQTFYYFFNCFLLCLHFAKLEVIIPR